MMHAIRRFTLGRTGVFYDVGTVINPDDLTASELDHLFLYGLAKEVEVEPKMIEEAEVQVEPEAEPEKIEKPKPKAKTKPKKAE